MDEYEQLVTRFHSQSAGQSQFLVPQGAKLASPCDAVNAHFAVGKLVASCSAGLGLYPWLIWFWTISRDVSTAIRSCTTT